MHLFETCAVILFGLVLGSFTTAMIYRIPLGISWIYEKKGKPSGDVTAFRSVCTSCKAPLSPSDLIPVFSWMFSGGKCRYCGAPVSVTYPLTELGVTLACLGIYMRYGLSLDALFMIALVPFLAALLVIDLKHKILPNQLILIIGGIGLLKLGNEFLVLSDVSIFLKAGLSALIYGGLIWLLGAVMGKILKKEALGTGDVKFFVVAGLWLGLPHLAGFCFLAGLFGVMFAILWKIFKKEQLFPFGPALISAFYTLLIFNDSLFV